MLVAIHQASDKAHKSRELLDELEELVRTVGIPVICRREIQVRQPQAKLFVGSGKAREIIADAEAEGCDVIVFDNELTPAQQRNWEALGDQKLLVIDRQEVILDIFGDRAQTREANLQVELARLEYNLPRLKRAWTHLNRQRGGGSIQRDAGETQLELDQRMIRTRIARLKTELSSVIQHREVQRKRRMTVPVPTGAIVGYTNAGKSSLLNALTGSTVVAEDKLFATLDPTSRKLALNTGQNVVLTDTVGFVRKLPHRLVDAFKATLEEAVVSNFLIHVLDAGNPEAEAHAETTREVLKELGAEAKDTVIVLNKVDSLGSARDEVIGHLLRVFPGALPISARTGEGIAALRERIGEITERDYAEMCVLIPHARYDLVAKIHREGSVRKERARDDGVLISGAFPVRIKALLRPYLVNKSEVLLSSEP